MGGKEGKVGSEGVRRTRGREEARGDTLAFPETSIVCSWPCCAWHQRRRRLLSAETWSSHSAQMCDLLIENAGLEFLIHLPLLSKVTRPTIPLLRGKKATSTKAEVTVCRSVITTTVQQ